MLSAAPANPWMSIVAMLTSPRPSLLRHRRILLELLEVARLHRRPHLADHALDQRAVHEHVLAPPALDRLHERLGRSLVTHALQVRPRITLETLGQTVEVEPG